MIIKNDLYNGQSFIISEDDTPDQLNVCVLAKCMFNCFYCINQQYSKQTTDFSELASIVIDLVNEKKLRTVSIQSGDFFIDTELQWFINKVLDHTKAHLHLFSNGYVFSLNKLKYLGWLNRCTCFTLSMYGLSDDEYLKMTGINGAFTRVMDNYQDIKMLTDLDIKVNINVLCINVPSEEQKLSYLTLMASNNINFIEAIL